MKWRFPTQFGGNLLNRFYFTVLNFIDSSSTPSHRRIHETAFVSVWFFFLFCEKDAHRKLIQLIKQQRKPKQCQEYISILQGVLTLLELYSRQHRRNASIPTTLTLCCQPEKRTLRWKTLPEYLSPMPHTVSSKQDKCKYLQRFKRLHKNWNQDFNFSLFLLFRFHQNSRKNNSSQTPELLEVQQRAPK